MLRYTLYELKTWRALRRKMRGKFVRPKHTIYIGSVRKGVPYFLPNKWGSIHINSLGWKDKFDSPRFEYPPSISITLLGLQLVIAKQAPIKDEDLYWEQVVWTLSYNDGDTHKAELTWGWHDYRTMLSTWDKSITIK